MQTIAAILNFNDSLPSSVAASATVDEAVTHMADLGLDALLVVEEEFQIAGVLTLNDIMTRVIAAQLDPHLIRVDEVMSERPALVSSQTSLEEAWHRVNGCSHGRLLVVDGGRVCGMVSLADITRLMVDDRNAMIADLTYYITHG